MKPSEKQYQTFNDGILYLHSATNIAQKGDRPNLTLKLKYKLRFQYKTVGISRFYSAMQYNISISEVIIVPQRRDICIHDIAIINGTKYDVIQVQHKNDTLPKTSQISLVKIEVNPDGTERI